MPRQPRIDFPGLLHHVIVRGIERCTIFREPRDYGNFVDRLARLIPETGVICYAWALMRNHVHLLLQTGPTRVATLMQRLLTGYATYFNLRYGRSGHLFQNRYKDIICQDDPYFLELVRYIPLNPVRAGLIRTPEELADYPWTSYSAAMGRIERPWQATGALLQRFGSHVETARKTYRAFLLDGWNGRKQDVLEGGGLIRSMGGMSGALAARASGDRQMFDQRILGSGPFVEQVLRQAEADELLAESMRNRSIGELLPQISGILGVDPSLLTEPSKVPAVSKAKSLLLYAGVAWLKRSIKEMGALVGISTGAASRAYRRGKHLAVQVNLTSQLEKQKGSNVP